MRHRKKELKIGFHTSHSKAMARNLITALVTHGHLETTMTKAKAIQGKVDKLFSYVLKHEPQIAIRHINEILFTKEASVKVMTELKEHFKDRTSGFTSISKVKNRAGDNAPLVRIELL